MLQNYVKASGSLLMDMDYILIPIHDNVHWWLCVVDIKNTTIYGMDSLHNRVHTRELQSIEAYLKLYFKTEGVQYKGWPIKYLYGPLQGDGFNCGVFVLIAMTHVFIRGISSDWDTVNPQLNSSKDFQLVTRSLNDYSMGELLSFRVFVFKCLQKKELHLKGNECRLCGKWYKDDFDDTYWVQCQECKVWLCMVCTDFRESANTDGYVFHCNTCR